MVLGRVRVLEPGVRFLDQQQLVQLDASTSEPSRILLPVGREPIGPPSDGVAKLQASGGSASPIAAVPPKATPPLTSEAPDGQAPRACARAGGAARPAVGHTRGAPAERGRARARGRPRRRMPHRQEAPRRGSARAVRPRHERGGADQPVSRAVRCTSRATTGPEHGRRPRGSRRPGRARGRGPRRSPHGKPRPGGRHGRGSCRGRREGLRVRDADDRDVRRATPSAGRRRRPADPDERRRAAVGELSVDRVRASPPARAPSRAAARAPCTADRRSAGGAGDAAHLPQRDPNGDEGGTASVMPRRRPARGSRQDADAGEVGDHRRAADRDERAAGCR